MKIRRKDLGIFVNCSILDDRRATASLFQFLLHPELVGEEVDLRLESIGLHVFVKVFKVRIISVGLKKRLQLVSTSQNSTSVLLPQPILPATAMYLILAMPTS